MPPLADLIPFPQARRRARAAPLPGIAERLLMTATMALLAFGAVMVFSATSAGLVLEHRSPTSYLLRYGISAAIGLIAMSVTTRMRPAALQRLTKPAVIVSLVLVVLVLIPGVGIAVNGGRRWLGASSLQLQPSELLKGALVLYAARLLSSRRERLPTVPSAARPLLTLTALSCILIVAEPDLGTALVIALTIGCTLWVAGVPGRRLLLIIAIAAAAVAVMALLQPYKAARLSSFLNPWHSATTTGFQAVQGQIAIGSGGLTGRGIGQSVQKAFFLPEASTDFILAVIGEETGVLGIATLLILYGMLALAGLRIGKHARDPYPKLLAVGATSLITSQALLNVFVVLGMAPLTGVPLPFISYGSSNLVVVLAQVGILRGVERNRQRTARQEPSPAPATRRARTDPQRQQQHLAS